MKITRRRLVLGVVGAAVIGAAISAFLPKALPVATAPAAASEVAVARTALLAGEDGAADERRCISLRAPMDGRVLQVLEQSERVVPAGTPILEIGDAARVASR